MGKAHDVAKAGRRRGCRCKGTGAGGWRLGGSGGLAGEGQGDLGAGLTGSSTGGVPC